MAQGSNVPICNTVSTGSKTRVRDPWKWYPPHRAIVLLGVVVTLIALAGAFLGVANASQAESLTAQLTQRYLVLLGPVRDDPGVGVRTSRSSRPKRSATRRRPTRSVPAAETRRRTP